MSLKKSAPMHPLTTTDDDGSGQLQELVAKVIESHKRGIFETLPGTCAWQKNSAVPFSSHMGRQKA
jgi:hypothetical protein